MRFFKRKKIYELEETIRELSRELFYLTARFESAQISKQMMADRILLLDEKINVLAADGDCKFVQVKEHAELQHVDTKAKPHDKTS